MIIVNEEELKKLFKGIVYTIEDDCIDVKHPKYSVYREITLTDSDELTINSNIALFLSSTYEKGKYYYYDGYFEALVEPSNYQQHFFVEGGLIINSTKDTDKTGVYYEIGELSSDFTKFLEHDLDSDYFYPEHNKSIKIFNVKLDAQAPQDSYLNSCLYACESAFFEIKRTSDIEINLLDLSDDSIFYDEFDVADVSSITNTEISLGKYDKDLLMYFNRATQMITSEFKYIAYFQVIECIFDEVYLYETVQDAKSIIESGWFRSSEFEHVNKLIKVIDKFNKDQNDKSKTKLVLEKYFRMNMHDDAFLIANQDIIDSLKELELIKNDSDFKDIQRIANILYDIRCDYTHSNRAFPKKRENIISKSHLATHIQIICLVAQKIISNYKKQ